ncbi:MAG: N-acetyltransferase [Clostridiales bacterium]|jgi:predicted N-acetyltransferase YhbS|nr:N-acetyltransferase [Clostridiales bacterium]
MGADHGIQDMHIREETPADYRENEELVREAFWNRYAPGATEHYVLKLLREEAGFEAWQSLVAEYEGHLIGQVLLSPAHIKGENGKVHEVLILGPVCCMNAVACRGVGSALMRAAIQAAKDHNARAIFLMGNPAYYKRFGFVPASRFGVYLPGADRTAEAAFFMALPLYEGALSDISGTFHESPAFARTEGFEDYDRSFPAKQKMKLPGQLQG